MLHAPNSTLPSFNYSLNDVHTFEDSATHFDGITKPDEIDSIKTFLWNSRVKRQRHVVDVRNYENKIISLDDLTTEGGPLALESRKKPGEAGSSAPLLNYIFDTYSNTHQHRNER